MPAGKSSSTLVKSRAAAFERQGGLCYYCKYPMWLGDVEPFASRLRLPLRLANSRRCTAEHLVARQDGGSDNAANIVAACFHCNASRHRRKRVRPPAEHCRFVQKRIAHRRWHPPQLLRLRAPQAVMP